MARRDTSAAAHGDDGRPAMPKKQRRRYARRLDGLQKRLARAEALVAKRSGQLAAANERRTGLADRIAALTEALGRPDGAASTDAVLAYCIRERTRVTIRDPRPVVLANGRKAVSGTCASCGARVMRLVGG